MSYPSAISTVFKRIKSIPADREISPEKWCQVQPCVTIKLGPKEIILTQPTSSFLVYLLGILTIGVGLIFFQAQGNEKSHLWWGIALILWGVGTLLAGTSYQAFSYQIKCAGRKLCAWTSWWEVIYLIFQQLSIDAILVAVAYSCTSGKWRTVLLMYAFLWGFLYTILAMIGGVIPVKSLITFELMVWISTPMIIIALMINSWRFLNSGNILDLVLMSAWLFLAVVMIAYWVYDQLDITTKLWSKEKRIWFSQNDVLHLGLILWMIYLAAVVSRLVSDF